MTEFAFIMFMLVITCLIFLVAFSVYSSRQRAKEIKKLREDAKSQSESMKSQVEMFNKMIDADKEALKSAVLAKAQLSEDFRLTTERLNNEKNMQKEFFQRELDALKLTYDKELGHRKSSEVRLGRIGESLAPFLNGWPWDPNNFRFIGNPIDGIQFTDDGIMFVEIKTGKARLSNGQKWIKDLVNDKKVSFVTFRIGEEGSSLQIEETKTNG
jgi:predicted Holliday junction resolvase-like endonuclease